ncbi:hypothetical protein MES5069_390038 [Mesorhizobium escarrei]|uniref:Uncharacterized protein n=1 Tax=Mesorhizobium escarrei TaxID=666018 RepID=A0ABM9E3B9_9HYPH|nr:hypothetical protein MES5069_390038 [Mesorhizobium escarrei]
MRPAPSRVPLKQTKHYHRTAEKRPKRKRRMTIRTEDAEDSTSEKYTEPETEHPVLARVDTSCSET